MPELRLDIVVNDQGAATKLQGIESAVKGVEGAAARTGTAVQASAVQSASAFQRMSSAASSWLKTASAVYGGLIIDRGVSALAAFSSEAMESSSRLVDLSAKSGLTIETLQRMNFVAKQSGVDLNALTNAATMLGVNLEKGTKPVLLATKELGLNFDRLRAMSPDEKFNAVVKSLEGVEDVSRRNTLALALFGGRAREVLPAIADGYSDLAAQADVSASSQVRALDDLGDKWDAWVENRKANFRSLLGSIVLSTQQQGVLGLLGNLGARMVGMGRAVDLAVQSGQPRPDINLPLDDRLRKNSKTLEELKEDEREAARAAAQAAREAQRDAERWRKALDDMSGRSAIKDAEEMIQQMREAGGLTVLNEDRQRKLNKAVGDALEAYARLGDQAPQTMLDIWRATMPALQATQGLANVIDKLPGASDWNPFSNLVRGGAPPLPPVGAGVPAGLPGVVNWNPFDSISKPDSFLKTAFGDVAQVGRTLGLALVDGVSSATDKIKTIFKSLAVNLGDQIGGALSRLLDVSMSGAGFFSKGLGKMLGGMFGSLIPMIGPLIGGLIDKIAGLFGNAGRDIVKDFAASKGGVDALHDELLQLGQAGEDLWIKLTQGVGRNNPEQAKAAVEEVTAALQRHQEALRDAMSEMPQAVVARSANITSQHDFSTVGAEAMGTFAFLVQQGQSAIAAFQAIAPAVEAMRVAMQGNNFEMTVAAERLFALDTLLTQHKVQFDNIAASGALLSAMLKANIMDAELFAAVSGDIGTQIQSLIDSGVSTQQVFALAQPQLQAIWEAQQKWHFEVDATTQALIDQAAQQGFVGEHMKSVNEQILAVLVAIGKVLGADIPQALAGLPGAAQAAAQGMNDAFKTVRPPKVDPGEWDQPGAMQTQEGPQMHDGGLINWRRMHRGGLASDEVPIIGQSGEFVMSRRGVASAGVSALERINRGGSVGGVVVNLTVNGSLIHEDELGDAMTRLVVPRLPDAVRELGLTGRH
jgi:hypothetical protein